MRRSIVVLLVSLLFTQSAWAQEQCVRQTIIPCPTVTPTPAPTTSPTTSPTPVPTPTPHPSIAKWESQMLVKGQKAWDELKAGIAVWKGGGSFDAALGPTYYDMGKVFLKICEYTGDQKWCTAANDAFSVYRDGWIIPIQGGTSGYWGFSNGMMLDFKKNGTANSKTGVQALANKAAYCAAGTPVDYTAGANVSRESAYCILHEINAGLVGGTPDIPYRDRLANQMLSPTPLPGTWTEGPNKGKPYPEGHIWQWINHTYLAPNPFAESPTCAGLDYFQPFMGFLSMQSAIQLYAVTSDPRVIPDLEALARFTWDNFWDPAKKAFVYENCRVNGSYPAKPGAPDLNLLGASVWEWLYAKTGNITYRQQGDQIFQGGVDGAYLDGAKQFNQNYTYSFDYVALRKK